MKLVYICSPLRGDVETNVRRAYGYCRFAATQDVLPLAPHAMFSGFLDDDIPEERQTGMTLGLELLKRVDELWVFGGKITEGMAAEIRGAEARGIPVQHFDEKCERRPA